MQPGNRIGMATTTQLAQRVAEYETDYGDANKRAHQASLPAWRKKKDAALPGQDNRVSKITFRNQYQIAEFLLLYSK